MRGASLTGGVVRAWERGALDLGDEAEKVVLFAGGERVGTSFH
jgi:hypothetical protein